MYRRVLRAVYGSSGQRVVSWMGIMVHIHLTAFLCLANHVTASDQSAAGNDNTNPLSDTSNIPASVHTAFSDLNTRISTENVQGNLPTSVHSPLPHSPGSTSNPVIVYNPVGNTPRSKPDVPNVADFSDLNAVSPDQRLTSVSGQDGPWWAGFLTPSAHAKQPVLERKSGNALTFQTNTNNHRDSEQLHTPQRTAEQINRNGYSRTGQSNVRQPPSNREENSRTLNGKSLIESGPGPVTFQSTGPDIKSANEEATELPAMTPSAEPDPAAVDDVEEVLETPFIHYFSSEVLDRVQSPEVKISTGVAAPFSTFLQSRPVAWFDGMELEVPRGPGSRGRQKRRALQPIDDAIGSVVTTEDVLQPDLSLRADPRASAARATARHRLPSPSPASGRDPGEKFAPSSQANIEVSGYVSKASYDVTAEVFTGSPPDVNPVDSSFQGRDVDITPYTTPPADVRSNRKRDLSPAPTSTPSPSRPARDTARPPESGGDWSGLRVKLGVILPFKGTYPWVIQNTHPALMLAAERVEREGILPNGSTELVLRDSYCSETYGPLQGIDLYVEKAANVFIGPACDYAVAPLARFTFKWQIPILTAGALVSAFNDRKDYRLLTRVQVGRTAGVKSAGS
ncbi:hypothetical protein ACOMHN_038661 [Nucella lapillus]